MFFRFVFLVSCFFSLFFPTVASADRDAALQQEIIRLQTEMNQKYDLILRRLGRIEQLLEPYSVKVVPEDQTKLVLPVKPTISKPARPKWQNPEAWAKIKPGMNQHEVIEILGEPTRVKQNIIDYVTLFYTANQSDVGALQGSVTFTDTNRVEYRGINPPVW